MKFTVEQFCVANGVDKPVGYGFLRFLSENGFATETKTEKVAGKRGKPSNVYTLDEATVGFFGTAITEYVAPAAAVAEVTEVKSETAETAQVSEQSAAV